MSVFILFIAFVVACGAIDQAEHTGHNLERLGDAFHEQGETFVQYMKKDKEDEEAEERQEEKEANQPIIIHAPKIIIVTPTETPRAL